MIALSKECLIDQNAIRALLTGRTIRMEARKTLCEERKGFIWTLSLGVPDKKPFSITLDNVTIDSVKDLARQMMLPEKESRINFVCWEGKVS